MSIGCYHRLPREARQSYKFTSPVYETPTLVNIISFFGNLKFTSSFDYSTSMVILKKSQFDSFPSLWLPYVINNDKIPMHIKVLEQ